MQVPRWQLPPGPQSASTVHAGGGVPTQTPLWQVVPDGHCELEVQPLVLGTQAPLTQVAFAPQSALVVHIGGGGGGLFTHCPDAQTWPEAQSALVRQPGGGVLE